MSASICGIPELAGCADVLGDVLGDALAELDGAAWLELAVVAAGLFEAMAEVAGAAVPQEAIRAAENPSANTRKTFIFDASLGK